MVGGYERLRRARGRNLHPAEIYADVYKRQIGSSGIEECTGKTIDYTLHYIRKLFDEEFEYNTEQGAAPEGQEELAYFMDESRSGNDMYFATAAALMFRKAGIPARYAERCV